MPAQPSSVAVYCGSNPGTDPAFAAAAASLGALLAERGIALVYGGGHVGLMGALADAVLDGGGEAHGVITRALEQKEIAHRGLTSLVITETMHQRKAVLADAADAFVMLPGGYGTLDEFFEMLTWAQLGIHAKPCAILDVDGYFDPLRAFLDGAVAAGFVHPAHRDMVIVDDDPARLLDRLAAWSPVVVSKWLDRADRLSRRQGKFPPVTSWVLHVDLDQFLAAVEVLRHPELRGKPLVVGGDGDPSKRGVVSTASYEARELGVHSGQPLRTARKRCPDCVFLPVDAPTYLDVSAEVMQVLRDTGAPVEVLGWDEAFVGISTDDPESFARDLAASVKEATRLDCSVGIGQNKLQAKMATGYGKPAGVFRLTSGTWYEFLGDRPPDVIWGIGVKTVAKLAGLGITTVRQLAAADTGRLAAEFGPMTGPWLVLLGQGRGDTEVDPTPYVARSHGREVTFQKNIQDWAEVRAEVARLARQVAAEVLERTVVRAVVKVRYAPFDTVTHGVQFPGSGTALPDPSALDAAAFEAAALAALAQFEPGRPVRLLGVRAEFADEPA